MTVPDLADGISDETVAAAAGVVAGGASAGEAAMPAGGGGGSGAVVLDCHQQQQQQARLDPLQLQQLYEQVSCSTHVLKCIHTVGHV